MTCPPGEREKQRTKTLGPVTIKLDHTQTARTGKLICRVVSIKQKEVKGLVIYLFGDAKLHMYLLLHDDDVPDKEIALALDKFVKASLPNSGCGGALNGLCGQREGSWWSMMAIETALESPHFSA